MQGQPKTINELFARAVERYNKPDALCYKHDGAWKPISHSELQERVRHLALGLYQLGLRKGDRVVLLCEHRPEWTITDLAILACGGVVVPIYGSLTAQHINYILKDCGARLAVVSTRAQLERLLTAVEKVEGLEYAIVYERVTLPHAGRPILNTAEVEQYGRQLATTNTRLYRELSSSAAPDDLATLIYTSGTTGNQKGVMLTHKNLISNLYSAFTDLDITDKDVALSFLPLAHVLERLVLYGYLDLGVTVYYAESIEAVPANLREVRPTILTSVPRLFEKAYQKIVQVGSSASFPKSKIFHWAMAVGRRWAMAELQGQKVPLTLRLQYKLAQKLVFHKWQEVFGGRLRYCVIGGAPLPPDLAYMFYAGGVPLLQGYGMTETSPVISLNKLNANRVGTVGRPIAGVEVKIAPDGEILARGPNVMKGYLNLPDETRETLTEDGWIKTGDIGHLDKDGYLVITDRKKDLIKTSGGKYVTPQPIESKIKASSLVSQVVVIGNSRKFPAALIVPNFETLKAKAESMGLKFNSNARMIADPQIMKLYEREVGQLTSDLAKWEKIKKIALLEREMTIESGELTPTLKVKRRVVEEKYKDVIDKLYVDAPGE
jgi:long-chain acyl-CoA synthetase